MDYSKRYLESYYSKREENGSAILRMVFLELPAVIALFATLSALFLGLSVIIK